MQLLRAHHSASYLELPKVSKSRLSGVALQLYWNMSCAAGCALVVAPVPSAIPVRRRALVRSAVRCSFPAARHVMSCHLIYIYNFFFSLLVSCHVIGPVMSRPMSGVVERGELMRTWWYLSTAPSRLSQATSTVPLLYTLPFAYRIREVGAPSTRPIFICSKLS